GACPTGGCALTIEQIDRCEACEQTDDRSDRNEAPVVLNCKASQDAEHFGLHLDQKSRDDTSEKFMCRYPSPPCGWSRRATLALIAGDETRGEFAQPVDIDSPGTGDIAHGKIGRRTFHVLCEMLVPERPPVGPCH